MNFYFLTALIGPLGLFYATVPAVSLCHFSTVATCLILKGALGDDAALMITAGSLLILYGGFWWIICIIWGIIAVNNYNRKIMNEATSLSAFLNNNKKYKEGPVKSIKSSFSTKPDIKSWPKENPYKGVNDYYEKFGV